ncbi:MAG: hypothetical protein WKF43_14165 [Acidimicrobiales bacterium]
MRVVRSAIFAVVVIGVLLTPTVSSAQVDHISFGDARLGLEGGTVRLPVRVTCEPGFNIAFGSASVAQSSGRKLAQGEGSFFNEFPGVPCTGAQQKVKVTVPSFSSFAFKPGAAAATAEVVVFDPVTGELVSKSVGPRAIQIVQQDQSAPATTLSGMTGAGGSRSDWPAQLAG